MKKILTVALLAVASVGYSQGTVNFNNLTNGIDAPIRYAAGTALGDAGGTNIDGALHPTAQAALYAGPDGATEAQLVLIAPAAGFGSNEFAGYVEVGALSERVIPLVAPGEFAMVQVRAWDANDGTTNESFEAASLVPGAYLGKSIVLRIATTGTPDLPADLVGLITFAIRSGTNQTITFDPLPAKTFGDPPVVLEATASSGLPVSYTSSDTNVASVEGNIVTILSPGTTLITASQEGDTNYFPASPVAQLLAVSRVPQAIAFDPLPAKTFGDPPFVLEATASSGLPVSYTSADTNVATVLSNIVTIVSPGTTLITASQEGDTNYFPASPVAQLLAVSRVSQAITFDPLPAKTFGDPPFALEATASSGLPVSYASSDTNVATVLSNIVTIVGSGTTLITASQDGDAIYLPAMPVDQLLTVSRVPQAITFDPLPAKTFGDPPFALEATASSGLPVSYTSSDTNVATVLSNIVTILSAGTTTITASQDGDTNYFPAVPVEQLLIVYQASQSITFDQLPVKSVGDPPFALAATASSGLPVSYTSSDTNVATVASNIVTILSSGTTRITASQEGDAGYEPSSLGRLLVIGPAPANDLSYVFTTLAGKTSQGNVDGVGDRAQFFLPAGVARDSAGNLYVAEQGGTIRKITAAGVVSTIAGFSQTIGSADGPGRNARFASPAGIAVDGSGVLYVTDSDARTIRKITPAGTNWVVSTIAGSAHDSAGWNDGPGGDARFNFPQGITVDSAGNLYVADTYNSTIRKITPVGTNWVVSTLAGLAGSYGSADGMGSNARFNNPEGITLDSAGNLYVADTYNGTIRQITPVSTPPGTNWVVTTIAGQAGMLGDWDGPGSAASFRGPVDIAVDGATNLYVTDAGNGTIRKITPTGTDWVVTTIAGAAQTVGNLDGTGSEAQFNGPSGLAVDGAGNFLYVADRNNNTIREVTTAGVVSTFAGSGISTGSADGTGSSAQFNNPVGIAVDSNGNIYVADTGNSTIRKITAAGVVRTVAGRAGTFGSDDGTGSHARFAAPQGIAVDTHGNIYVADSVNNTIRKVTAAGVVTTIAGQGGIQGNADGPGGDARFSYPFGIAVDGAGNLYVADSYNFAIRKITPVGADWEVTTIAGGIIFPESIAVDSATNLYVLRQCTAEELQFGACQGVTKIILVGTDWVVSHLDQSTAGGKAIAVDSAGNLFLTTANNQISSAILEVTAAGTVSTIGGKFGVNGNLDGTGSGAYFNNSQGVAVDSAGDLYIADTGNNTIRKGVFRPFTPVSPVPYTPPAMNASLTVTLSPPESDGQWRFPWEFGWHHSGYTATNLVAGNYPVEFRNMSGWLTLPLSDPVAVPDGEALSITNEYFPTLLGGDTDRTPGTLTVFMGFPQAPAGAGWRFLGEDTPFLPNAFTTNLLPGTYLIEFAFVTNRVKPPSQAVQIISGQPNFLSVNYPLAPARPAGVYLPFPVPPNLVDDEGVYPFGFNGQLQSDNGYGSGVAVDTHVVLTAAHLVFNDVTLAYVSHAYWFLRREAGVSEPLPQAARSYFVLSGYAAQRTNDFPVSSSPQSRNLDVAALYFSEPVAGGGHGGYLPSDAVPNTWLTSTALKMLVGYPVDGSQFGASITSGKMYQTDPQPYPLSIATDPVPGQQEVYLAPWFLSYPGNSGGPLYVQLNGSYYPAAVYLGTLFSGAQPYASVVRAIDSNVVNLITNAAALGASGTNFTGGGVINIIPSAGVNASHPGYVQFRLTPPSAVRAGAGWRLQGDAVYSTATNYTRTVTSTNAFAVEFKPLPGWNSPASQNVAVQPGQLTPYTAFYTATNPVLVIRDAGFGMTGTTGTTYRVEQRSSFPSGSWSPLGTNTIRTTGFNPVLTNPPPGFYRLLWLTNF